MVATRLHSAAVILIGCAMLAASGASAQHQPLVPNSQRYRERNPSAIRGRSGSAAITARALASLRTGKVSFEATTGLLDTTWPAPIGSFTALQLKGFKANGTVASTDVLSVPPNAGTLSYDVVPLALGQTYQVQANVRGANGARTDVVTARGTVRPRPDLTIAFEGPTRVPGDTAVPLTAVVSNLGTDVGAVMNCRLYVGDSPDFVDQASFIWVDGGDSVSCVFSHVFTQLGAQPVRVAVTDVVPADDDAGNNVASAVIDVFENATPSVTWTLTKQRSVLDEGHRHSDGWYTFEYPRQGSGNVRGSDWNYDYDYDVVASENVELTLSSKTIVSFPLASYDVSFVSGGQTVGRLQGTNAAADYEYGDANAGGAALTRYDDATRTILYVSTYHDQIDVNSLIYAQRVANRTTYWASGYQRYWMSWAPGQDTYNYYTPLDEGYGALSPVLDETVLANVADHAGRTFTGGGTVSPTSEEQSLNEPLQCYDLLGQTVYGWETAHVCASEDYHAVTSYGGAVGTTGGY